MAPPPTGDAGNERAVVVRKRGRPRLHPQGIPTILATLQDKDVVPGPNSNYINVLMANSRIRSFSSITYGTLENYKVGWSAYVSFCCNILQCSPTFTDRFKEWRDSDREREGAEYQVVVITGFAEHIMLGGKQSGHVVCKYMTAVRFMLIHCGVNIDFMQNPLVRGTRVAMEKVARKREVDEGKGDKRWPATTAFVTELSMELASWQSYEGHALTVGAQMAFCFLLRCSEYLITSKNQPREEEDDEDPVHTIRANDVWLEFEETLDPAKGKQMVLVRPMDAHKHKLQDLIAVDFQIPSSKTDQAGLGIPFYSPRLKVGKKVAFDVVETIYNWSVLARPAGLNPFLSWDNGTKWPSYRKFNATIKKVAARMGLDASKATTHVLRIGGATAMSAAGLPDHLIMVWGRWKSLAFLLYTRLSKASSACAMEAIMDPAGFTNDDVFRNIFVTRDGVKHKKGKKTSNA